MKSVALLFALLPSFASASDLCSSMALFTPMQVEEGKTYFESSCGMCHQYTLKGRQPGNVANEIPNSFDGFPDSYLKFMDNSGGSVPPPAAPKTDFWPDTEVRLAAYILSKNCEQKSPKG
jgi:hypothetical protein